MIHKLMSPESRNIVNKFGVQYFKKCFSNGWIFPHKSLLLTSVLSSSWYSSNEL